MCYIYTWNNWVMVGSLSNWIINIAVSDTSRIVNKSSILSQNLKKRKGYFSQLYGFYFRWRSTCSACTTVSTPSSFRWDIHVSEVCIVVECWSGSGRSRIRNNQSGCGSETGSGLLDIKFVQLMHFHLKSGQTRPWLHIHYVEKLKIAFKVML